MKLCGSLEASLTFDFIVQGAESHLEGETSLRFTDETNADMSQSQSDETPEPGDLIEIFRGVYEHWAVYVGDDYVVHVTSPPGGEIPGIVSNSISVPGAASSSLMSVPTEKSMVRKQKLEEVVGKRKWKINNILDKKYKPRPAHIIVKEALKQVGKMMEYSVLRKNCEHFATKLRYGKAESMQVLEAEPILTTGFAVVAVAVLGVGILGAFILTR